ncbi:MAG: disulfide bond formation protein B [Candidatus Levyibacteriota bacterium]
MNPSYTPFISFLSLGTIILDIFLILGLLLYALSFRASKKSRLEKIASFLGKNSIEISMLAATFASLSTLFLSEIAGLVPCELCWYQRVFMFPQVVILGIALLKNDTKVRVTSLALSVIGLGIAVYHILLQFYPAFFPCTDRAISCALTQFKDFGYVTIPVMSATVFSLIILLMLFGLRRK